MNVTKEENKSLHTWIGNVRKSFKRIQEGRTPSIKLTPDQMKALGQIGFEFENSHGQEKHENTFITETINPANTNEVKVENENEEMEKIKESRNERELFVGRGQIGPQSSLYRLLEPPTESKTNPKTNICSSSPTETLSRL